MKIRYQNGTAIEGLTLFRTDEKMRIAVKGGEDVMELTNIHGTWVSDECEPVIMETGTPNKLAADFSDENFICPQELAQHLVSLLFIDSAGDFFDEPDPTERLHTGTSPLIA